MKDSDDEYDVLERVAIMIFDGGLSEEAAIYHAKRLQREKQYGKANQKTNPPVSRKL